MFYAAFVLWLWRGGDGAMSTQPTDIPAGTPARTIHDVELDLAAARYAQRRGPGRRYPDDITRFDVAVNTYLDEWAWHKAGGPALDFPAPIDDDTPTVTMTGGPLDADCG